MPTVDGLSLDQIAATYHVHRATVARTLKSARTRVLLETRVGVIEALGIEEGTPEIRRAKPM